MKRRVILPFAGALLLTACATDPPVSMYAPTDEEVAACEAQGGSIEPAYALDTYVCLLPADPPQELPTPNS